MKFVLVLLACLVGLAQPLVAQPPTPDEFQQLRSFVIKAGVRYQPETGEQVVIPGRLAQLLGWSTGGDVASQRVSLDERNVSDGKGLIQYAADVVPGRERMVLVSELRPGDTTVCVLFNDSGSIIRVFEIFEVPKYEVREVQHRGYDQIGYRTWRILVGQLPK